MWTALFALLAEVVRFMLVRAFERQEMADTEWTLAEDAHERAVAEAKRRLRREYEDARARSGPGWFDRWRKR